MFSRASADIAVGIHQRICKGPVRQVTAVTGMCIALLFVLASCTTPLDMSGEPITPLGPEWGVVIGSVLVQPQKAVSGRDPARHDASDYIFEFNIVPIQPGDPNGENPYAETFRLNTQAGEERIFVSRLRSGQYLIRNFQEEGVTGLDGELGVVFSSMAGEIRYIGRLRVEIPERASKGKGYRFAVEDAREPTLAQVSRRHPDLTKDVADKPMQIRERPSP